MTVSEPQRVGVYGGAFDPPHLAHVALARTAISQLWLDRLLIIPTGLPWHKQRQLSPGAHRLAMARLAFGDAPQVTVDDRETLREGTSYTIDTLEDIHSQQPQARLFLLIGEDQLAAFCAWHRWRDILLLATLCVARRGDATQPLALPWGASAASASTPHGVVAIDMPFMPHASTELRARVARGEPVQHWVGEGVSRYIAQHHLYQAA